MAGERLVLIMPAYNAARTVAEVFARIPAAVQERIHRYVAVDDGSTDDTLAILEGLAGRLPRLDVLRHDRNRGYGAAEKTLLDHALALGADICILVHADGQYPPERIPDLITPLERGDADLVQGSRMLGGGALAGGMPLYKYL
ncbi:MAG: glycosyltransferase family 2 protein, partial [Thermodesulfobacteriota bacterium]